MVSVLSADSVKPTALRTMFSILLSSGAVRGFSPWATQTETEMRSTETPLLTTCSTAEGTLYSVLISSFLLLLMPVSILTCSGAPTGTLAMTPTRPPLMAPGSVVVSDEIFSLTTTLASAS